MTVGTAEYKQVTVLFADVVHSMDLAAALDMERLRDVMTELLERVLSGRAPLRRNRGVQRRRRDGRLRSTDHVGGSRFSRLPDSSGDTGGDTPVGGRGAAPRWCGLQVRVGLNSGRVIAGEIGSGSLGYRAIGEHVGIAQRMESAAPPGDVMLSDSTARLVENKVTLADPEWVHVKGVDDPVRAHRLLAIGPRDGRVGRAEASLVGRRWEMAALEAMMDRAIGSRGGVVNVVGPPGIGKSRVAREAAALAAARGVEVYWTFCESHASDVPFGVVTRLLRAGSGVADLDGDAARAQAREQVPDADPQDLLLLDDLLGIANPEVALPQIDPDARRRRLTALINTAALARTTPALFIIEDAHWIDAVSESMLADLITVIPRTPSMVLITSRPEYDGALTRTSAAQTIALAPLDDSDTAALLGELLGTDPSVGVLAGIIAGRAAGNPFFAEEMVREFEQRGVLDGEHGNYVCRVDVAEVSVPATVQAAIEARIDRLTNPAKQTLNAAAVIGARFGADLLDALGIDAAFDELLSAELIDQVRFTPSAEYAFRHPLIRAVAYESQLKSDRAHWHRRLATAIQERDPASVEDNAALIAEHLQAAGDLHAAYGWHMRAAASSTNRDIAAARLSWERARQIADRLPDDDPGQLPMRIAPTTMLCATDWQARTVREGRGRFAELRELCSAAGDKVSLAIGMTGQATEVLYAGRSQGSRLASEQMALLESIGDPTLTVGLAVAAFAMFFAGGEFGELLRWSQTVVDLAGGDPAKGAGFGIGSPLAGTMAWRGVARWWLGRPGWRQDLDEAVAMARDSGEPTTVAGVVAWTYGLGIQYGVLLVDDSAIRALEDAVQTTQRGGNDYAMSLAEYTLGVALLNRDTAADRHRGLELMMKARDMCLREGVLFLVPVTELWVARDRAARGDRDAAIPVMRQAVEEMHQAGGLGYGVWGTRVLVEALLERGAEGDLAEAQKAFDRLAHLPATEGWVVHDMWLLRLRALLARARGDDIAYRDLSTRYRAIAESLGFDGHIAWAEAMAAEI